MDHDNLPLTLRGPLGSFGPHVSRRMEDTSSTAATRRSYVRRYVARVGAKKRPLEFESTARNGGAMARLDEVFGRRMECQHGRTRRAACLRAHSQGRRAH